MPSSSPILAVAPCSIIANAPSTCGVQDPLVTSNYQHWGTRPDGSQEPYDTAAVSVVANVTMPYPEPGGSATVAPYGWASMQPGVRNQFMCRMQSKLMSGLVPCHSLVPLRPPGAVHKPNVRCLQ